MKHLKATLCALIVFGALVYICNHFNNWQAMGEWHYDAQLMSLTDWLPVLAIISLFLGYLPVYCFESYKEQFPPLQEQEATQDEQQQPFTTLYVGQSFTSEGSNCKLTIKSIKIPGELSF